MLSNNLPFLAPSSYDDDTSCSSVAQSRVQKKYVYVNKQERWHRMQSY